MFQDFALFPHLTVQQNVYFGLSGSKEFKKERSFNLFGKGKSCSPKRFIIRTLYLGANSKGLH
jgi:ABC-type sugar transport system ATPase subunit